MENIKNAQPATAAGAKEQSSVEWYANEEDKLFTSYQKGFMSTAKYILFKYKLREQAKAMHTKEITNAHINGQSEFDTGARRIENDKLAKQYYILTFGGSHD